MFFLVILQAIVNPERRSLPKRTPTRPERVLQLSVVACQHRYEPDITFNQAQASGRRVFGRSSPPTTKRRGSAARFGI
jgi:hypothetical protein